MIKKKTNTVPRPFSINTPKRNSHRGNTAISWLRAPFKTVYIQYTGSTHAQPLGAVSIRVLGLTHYLKLRKRATEHFQLPVSLFPFPQRHLGSDELPWLREGREQAATGWWAEDGLQPAELENWKKNRVNGQPSPFIVVCEDARPEEPGRGQGPHCSLARPNRLPHSFVSLTSWPPLDGTIPAPKATAGWRGKPEDFAWVQTAPSPGVCGFITVSLTSEVAVWDCQPWGCCHQMVPISVYDARWWEFLWSSIVGPPVIRKQWHPGDQKTSRILLMQWESPKRPKDSNWNDSVTSRNSPAW